MRIHHLNCGTMCPAVAPLINGQGSFFSAGRMICHCLLLETKHGLVLVDTGIGAQAVRDVNRWLGAGFRFATRPQLRPEESAIEQVRALGFSENDVRHIVVTHLDLDHAGGLADFPAATVHVFAPEHDAALNRPTFRERNRYRAVQFAHQPKWQIHRVDNGERWHDFEAVRALEGTDEEVLIVPVVGHSRGHAAIAVRRPDGGWLLHCGDAYFFHGQLDAQKPHCPIGLEIFQSMVAVDNVQRLANTERLRQLKATAGAEIELFSAHDPVELERY